MLPTLLGSTFPRYNKCEASSLIAIRISTGLLAQVRRLAAKQSKPHPDADS